MLKQPEVDFPALLWSVLRLRLHAYCLTPREDSVVHLLLQGYSNKEIAERCLISEQTVKDHLKHIYQKVGAHQRTALVARLLGTSGP